MPAIYALLKYKVKTGVEAEAQMEEALAEQEEVTAAVKNVGVPVTEQASYQAFGAEIMEAKRKHAGAIALNEAAAIQAKWASRGLSGSTMNTLRYSLW